MSAETLLIKIKTEVKKRKYLFPIAYRILIIARRIKAWIFLIKAVSEVLYAFARHSGSVSSGSATNEQKIILMLTISQIEIDPRINKVAKSMASRGYTVKIICYQSLTCMAKEEHPFPGVIYKRIPAGKIPKWLALYYQDTIFNAGMNEKCDYVHANDFTTLIVGWLLAKFKNVPLIYDAHEMWVENVEYSEKREEYLPMSQRKKGILGAIEERLVKDADVFISVSKSICDEYKRRFKLEKDVILIPNYPELSTGNKNNLPTIREACRLDKSKFIILYIGGVNPVRNIEGVINALKYLPDECVFVIQGPGVRHYEDKYRNMAETIGVEERVFFLDEVGLDGVIDAASSADCGIVMLRNMGLNFYWFYPNKFFEYMLAGIPVAVSNFPDVTEHVNREKCGVTFDPDNPESIAAAIKWLYDNPKERIQMGKRGQISILEKYNWEAVVSMIYNEYERLNKEKSSL